MATLLLTENFPAAVGDTGRCFWELCRRMPRAGVMVAAGTQAGAAEFDRTHDVRVQRVPLWAPDWGVLSTAGWRRHRQAVVGIRALVGHEDVGVTHCARRLPEARWCRRPYGGCVHGEELNTVRISRELRWLGRYTVRRAAFFVANTQNTARPLVAGWGVPASRIRLGTAARRFEASMSEAAHVLGIGGGR